MPSIESLGFDAAFALAALLSWLNRAGESVGELVDALPAFSVLHDTVPCGWEAKGGVMRRLAETYEDADLTDGIKISNGDDWVLAMPDAMEPLFHVYAEGGNSIEADLALTQFRREIETLVGEAS